MSKIVAAIEALAHNATHPKFITGALTEVKEEIDALKERVSAIGNDASGNTGEAVTALGSRLDSLTSAVSWLGSTVGALLPRIEALEAKAPAPAPVAQVNTETTGAPVVPPVTA